MTFDVISRQPSDDSMMPMDLAESSCLPFGAQEDSHDDIRAEVYIYVYIRIHMGTNICIYVYMYMCICIVLLGTNIPNFEVTCPGHLTLKCTDKR